MGSDGDDKYFGGVGDDVMLGSEGFDYFDGGADDDTVDYSASPEGVWVHLGYGAGYGGHAEGDIYVQVENVVGSAHRDWITGDDGANRLIGGGGDDVFYGTKGDDVIDGGAGFDQLHVGDPSIRSVGVYLDRGTVYFDDGSLGVAGFTQVTSVEEFFGTRNGDRFHGDAGENAFRGLGGDDQFFGSLGADILDGGAGDRDFASYAGDGLTENLLFGRGWGGEAEGDTLIGIEDVSIWGDDATLIGDARANTLKATGENATVLGGAGDDRLEAIESFAGALSNAHIDGGADVDTVDYRAWGPRYGEDAGLVVDLRVGTVTAVDTRHDAGRDTIVDVEIVIGSAGNDVFFDEDGADTVFVAENWFDDADTFVFAHAEAQRDAIEFFVAGEEKLDLSATAVADYFDLLDGDATRIEQDGSDVVIHTGEESSIRLFDVALSALSESDFIF